MGSCGKVGACLCKCVYGVDVWVLGKERMLAWEGLSGREMRAIIEYICTQWNGEME